LSCPLRSLSCDDGGVGVGERDRGGSFGAVVIGDAGIGFTIGNVGNDPSSTRRGMIPVGPAVSMVFLPPPPPPRDIKARMALLLSFEGVSKKSVSSELLLEEEDELPPRRMPRFAGRL